MSTFPDDETTQVAPHESTSPLSPVVPYNMSHNSTFNIFSETQDGSGFISSITLFFWQVLPPPVIILGTAGNILSFLVMCRKRLSDTRMSLCLRLLAVVDTVVLWTGHFRYWLWKTLGMDIRSLNDALCKSHPWLVGVSSQLAAWIIVCIAVDRFIVVYCPHFGKRTFSKLKTTVALLLITFVLLVLNSHFFWSLRINQKGYCDVNYDIPWLATLFLTVWPWIDLSFYSITPALMIGICNLGIILKVRLPQRRRSLVTRGQQLSVARVNTMTYTLMIISLMFLLTTLPICMFMVVHITSVNALTAGQGMWFAVVNFLSYLNSASNFLLYLISSSYFRSELVDMLCCGRIQAKERLALEGPLVASVSNAGRFAGEPPEGTHDSQIVQALIQ